jgi:hypothetical protein
MNVKRFRKTQTITSILTFISVFLFCWYVTEFKITDIQLSFWGADSKYSWLWNFCLSMLSISIFINIFIYINQHTRLNSRYLRFHKLSFLFTSLCLFITGIFNLHYEIHNITAYLYFFSYPLVIFLFAHLNRKTMKYDEWKTHLIFSIAMVMAPLTVIKFFPGMAVSEIIHSILIIGWNAWILTID